jgi:cytochrome c-type biogenesis protein CcsB
MKAFSLGGGATNQSLSLFSNHLLWASGAALCFAFVAFLIDLAGHPGRVERAREAQAAAAAAGAGAQSAQGGGDTAVLTKAPPAGQPPVITEKRQYAGIGMALSWLGTLLVVACTVTRGMSVSRLPLGNMYEFTLVGICFTMLVFMGWSLKRDVRSLGAFVVGPMILVEMLAGVVFYTAASDLLPSLQNYWLTIHVTVAIVAVAFSTVAFSTTILYFVQAWREKLPEKKFTFMDAVPDSKTMDRLSYGLIIIAFPLWTFTLIAGAIWAQKAWGHYWTWDPKEVWTLVVWVVYAAYLHARATAGWTGRKAAYISVAGFVCILINFCIVNVFFAGMHSYSGM